MAAILSIHSIPDADLVAFFDPPMVRVHNKDEKKAFLASRRYRLNDYKVW